MTEKSLKNTMKKYVVVNLETIENTEKQEEESTIF